MLELAQMRGMRFQRREIVARGRQAQQRQRAVGVALAQFLQRRHRAFQLGGIGRARKAAIADAVGEQIVEVLTVVHRGLLSFSAE